VKLNRNLFSAERAKINSDRLFSTNASKMKKSDVPSLNKVDKSAEEEEIP